MEGRVDSLGLWFVKGDCPFQMCARFGVIAQAEQCCTQLHVGAEEEKGIVQTFGQRQALFRQLERGLVIRTY
jgi:hypothetical protein